MGNQDSSPKTSPRQCYQWLEMLVMHFAARSHYRCQRKKMYYVKNAGDAGMILANDELFQQHISAIQMD